MQKLSPEIPVHPSAAIFPLMGEAELQELAADIAKNGQRIAIVLADGLILDGRNRYAACRIAGVEPRTQAYEGTTSPTDFVVAMNLRRRHLTAEQRAAVAVELEAAYAKEAKERQRAAGKAGDQGGRPATKTLSDKPSLRVPGTVAASVKQDPAGRSIVQAATAVGAGVKATETLKAVRKEAPEVFELAKEGKVNVTQAKRLAESPPGERAQAVVDIRAGAKPASVMKPAARQPEKDAFDIGESLLHVRQMLRKELDRWPERYRPNFIHLLKQVASELED